MKEVSYCAFLCGVALLLAQGCKVPQYEDGGIQVIDKSNLTNVEAWQFNDLYKEVSVVPLETSERSMFGNILQTVCADSTIFVRASFSSDSNDAGIWQFDSSGKLLRQLGTVGEGPGEYHSIGSIVLKGDILYAFDDYNNNVHLFEATSGEYLVSSEIDGFEPLSSVNTVLSIPNSPNFLFSSDVFFGDETYGLAECNPQTSYFKVIVPQKFKVSSWISYEFARPTLSKFEDKHALAILPLNDTIYSVDYVNWQVKPFAIVDMGVRAPEFADGEEYEKALEQANEKKYTNRMAGIYASQNYLIINKISGSIVWNMEQRKGFSTLNGWKQSEETEIPFYPINIVEAREDNTFICAYSAEEYIEYFMPHMKKSGILRDNGEEVSSESNDVLVIYKLK